MCSIVVNVPDCQSGDWSSILPHPANLISTESPDLKCQAGKWKNKPNGKAVVLKTTSSHLKVMCELESHFFLNGGLTLMVREQFAKLSVVLKDV